MRMLICAAFAFALVGGRGFAADKKKTSEELVADARAVYEAAAAEIEKKLGKKKDSNEKNKLKYLEALGNATVDFYTVVSAAHYQEDINKTRKPEAYNEALVKKLNEEKNKILEEIKKLNAEGLNLPLFPHDGKWVEYKAGDSSIEDAEVVYNIAEFDFAKFKTSFFEKRDRCYGMNVAGFTAKTPYLDPKTRDYWYSFDMNKYIVFWCYFKSGTVQSANLNLKTGKEDEELEKTVEKVYMNFAEVAVKKKLKLDFREGYNHLMIVCKNTGRATFELSARLEAKKPLQILKLTH